MMYNKNITRLGIIIMFTGYLLFSTVAIAVADRYDFRDLGFLYVGMIWGNVLGLLKYWKNGFNDHNDSTN